VRRMDLTEVALTLKAAGVLDIAAFRWLRARTAVSGAGSCALQDLGALARDGVITELGRRMLAFPVHPRYARMLLAADEYGCVPDAACVAALTQGRPMLRRGSEKLFKQKCGDCRRTRLAQIFFSSKRFNLPRPHASTSPVSGRRDSCRSRA
jgi:ATP-dependent helicase HrpB